MKLTKEQKQNIINEFEQWKQKTYGNLSDKQRKDLGAFHTPPLLTIKMIEKFDDLDVNELSAALAENVIDDRFYVRVSTYDVDKVGEEYKNLFCVEVWFDD